VPERRYVPTGRSCKELETLIQKHGWRYLRAEGSHRYYVREGDDRLTVIPWHRRKSLKRKTEAAILKQAGLR